MGLRVTGAVALALAGAISISCGGVIDPSQNQIESFSGTVQPGSSRAHAFTASKTGELTVKLGALTPASQPVLGMQWVQSGDGSCNGAPLQVNQFATANSTAIAGQIPSGNYCIIVYDSVGLTQPENYSGTISHP